MYSGWVIKWRVNRNVSEEEYASGLLMKPLEGACSDDKGTLTAFNSTYVEFVDRRFRLRGGFGTMIATVWFLFSLFFIFFAWLGLPHQEFDEIIGVIVISSVSLLSGFISWYVLPRLDFFNCTNYPVRFNRRTRMVYVYRSSRDGGILAIPWGEGFFHVGKGLRNKYLLDLRCHVLDDNMVSDTFVVGAYFDDETIIRNLWTFICKYMDEGPDAVRPRHLMISTKPTWKNCYIFIAGNMRLYSSMKRFLFAPVLLLFAGFRWLVMVTCRPPVWPQVIEDACRIDEIDPNRLPEPDYIGQFSREADAIR